MLLLNHAGPLLLDFFDTKEARALRTVSTAFAACFDHHQVDFHFCFRQQSQWSTVLRRSPKVHTLRAFPNTILRFGESVNIHFIKKLCLDNCGLTYDSVKTTGLSQSLKKACSIEEFSLNDNPDLRTSGLSRLLHSLGIAGARLQSLHASNTGVKTLYQPASPLLQDLRVIDLSNNALTDPWKDILPLHQLEKLYVDLVQTDEMDTVPRSVNTVSWCRCGPSLASSLLSSANMVRVSLACAAPLTRTFGACLKDVSLAEVKLSREEWASFLRDMAIHTCIEELVLCKVSNLTGEALGSFVDHLPRQTKFQALGLRHITGFTYPDLECVLGKIGLRDFRMRKWILQDCIDLKFPAAATSFLQTLDLRQPMYLDVSTRSILSLSRRDEASWISSVLSATTFSYLGLGGRSAILSTVPIQFLADTAQLSLEGTEINWGLCEHMIQLRVLSLYNIESRYLYNDALLEQALRLPRICHLRLDYCRLDSGVVFPIAKYVHILDLNWCDIGDEFRNSLLQALVAGKLPALSSLGIMGSNPRHASFLCLLLLAMKGGQRRCNVDARGLQWTRSQLKFLMISLKQLHAGDLSRLRINVHKDAQSEWRRMCLSLPDVLFH